MLHRVISILKKLIQTLDIYSIFPLRSSYKRRCSVSTAIDLFLHSFLSDSPFNELSHDVWGKEYGHLPRSTTRTEGVHTMGFGLFPKMIVHDTAITIPALCSLRQHTFRLGVGIPNLRYQRYVVVTLATPHIPTSHVTLGMDCRKVTD